MGLAASQARLLTLTARLADNELRSQTINNAKMRLSTESSQASENYINALNNATLKFTNYSLDGTEKAQNLSFNALTAYSSYNTQYGLVNAAGQLLVSEDEAALFIKSGENLNTYLQYHGLTYETSYFKEVGNVTNEGYVEPFNYITVSEMESMYKNYNSYENSQEVENFNNAYNKYLSSNSSLSNAASKTLESLFTNEKSSPKVSSVNGIYEMQYSSNNLSDIMTELKTAFNNPANTFAFNNQIIGQLGLDTPDASGVSDLDRYKELLNSIEVQGNGYVQSGDVGISEVAGGDSAVAGTKTYKIDDGVTFTVDSETGLVTAVELSDSKTSKEIENSKINCSLAESIAALKLNTKDSAGNIEDSTTYAVNGTDDDGLPKITARTFVPSPSESDAKDVANNILTEILKDMSDNYGIDFAETLYNEENPNAASNRNYLQALGIQLDKPISGTTQTLKEYYLNYANAENNYLGTVFDENSIEKVKEDIDKGSFTDASGNSTEITYKNLTDVDFLLRYMNSQGLTPSSNFETVIKEFVIDKVIEEYGTPKYAWQDSTDTNNTGNADSKAQWYTNLFNRMMQGYKVLENGLASSSEWIEYALESGIVTMEQVDSSYNWQGLDYKSCARITEETDDAAVTKAEAEYNRAMNDIESKDSLYDLELKNIDTEHSSLQTEYESIKGVISKNVERTFNFYKNA